LAMSKDRNARPQTAGEMWRMLEGAAEGISPPMREAASAAFMRGARIEDLELDLPAQSQPPVQAPAAAGFVFGPVEGAVPEEEGFSESLELALDIEPARRPSRPSGASTLLPELSATAANRA